MVLQTGLKTDTQISPEHISQLILEQALEQMSELTGLNIAQCKSLFVGQLQANETPTIDLPIINNEESQFIGHLFN
jgi:hypothetical protein